MTIRQKTFEATADVTPLSTGGRRRSCRPPEFDAPEPGIGSLGDANRRIGENVARDVRGLP